MPNPYLPLGEYIPDGEPRVFGDRVYIYGSHDIAGSDKFCDDRLKVWSAPVSDPNNWICHGDIYRSVKGDLYAPDVVEKDGKYYLYAYINGEKGRVTVSDSPIGPFKFLSYYEYKPDQGDGGIFIDPGALVDDGGRVYVYCGFKKSFMAELNPENMCEVIGYKDDIIPVEMPFDFFEACSPRKVGDTYYMIYSQNPPNCGKLVYATSKSPFGPFEYGGVIVDNGKDYPGGNNHGSICKVGDQWYIFYHRMTNNTIMSRRACVEPIEIAPDGSIKEVEMTSLGFEKSLNPYKPAPAEIACLIRGGAYVNEKSVFERTVTNIKSGCELGYKYFDFGDDLSNCETMTFSARVKGVNGKGVIRVFADNEEIGSVCIGTDDGVYSTAVKSVSGRSAVYLKIDEDFGGDFKYMYEGRHLFELVDFVFRK